MSLMCSPPVMVISSFSRWTALLFTVLACCVFTSTEAYDPLDPLGNITIKWDIVSWTPDGYVAVVTMYNYQQYRHIEAPGWSLGWTWAGREIIWSMVGAQTTMQGDCSRFKGNVPHSCEKRPTVVDLLPGTPYNQQVANCCKGGVLSSLGQDPANAASSFQIAVGGAGTTNRTVRLPTNFTLKAPGPGYICGPAKIVKPTKFITPDGRRVTQAMMTWNATCTYSQYLAHRRPTCCVSLSSVYNNKMVPCPKCSCSCQSNNATSRGCVGLKSEHLAAPVPSLRWKNLTPVVQCSSHMCPIRVNWHVKLENKDYLRAEITITNYNRNMKYTDWNLVIQHPSFNNVRQISGFKYKSITSHAGINGTTLLWGVKSRNDVLMKAGPSGNVHGELLFRKGKGSLASYPLRIYFNGENCVVPPMNEYPFVANWVNKS